MHDVLFCQRVPYLTDDVAKVLVTLVIVVGFLGLVLIHPDMVNEVLPIVTLTIGHFFGRNQRQADLRDKKQDNETE